jgi:hypothetical protein
MARQYSNPPDRGCSWSVSSERSMMDHMPRVGEGWHRDGGRVGTGGAAAKLARSPRCCALCRPHRPARREQKNIGEKGLARSGNSRIGR